MRGLLHVNSLNLSEMKISAYKIPISWPNDCFSFTSNKNITAQIMWGKKSYEFNGTDSEQKICCPKGKHELK